METGMRSPASQEAIELARGLLDLFKLERRVYLGVNVVVLAFLVPFGIISTIKSGGDYLTVIAAFFGMTGAVTYTTSRLLRMWSEVLAFVMKRQATIEGGGLMEMPLRPNPETSASGSSAGSSAYEEGEVA